MLISTSKRFVFVHVPKTGGSTLTNVFSQHVDSRLRNQETRMAGPGWQGTWHFQGQQHSCLEPAFSQLVADGTIDSDYTVVSMIRHPWDRYFSAWLNLDKRLMDQTMGSGGSAHPVDDRSFEHYIRTLRQQRACKQRGFLGFQSQTEFLASNNRISTLIGRFETYEQSVTQICNALGIDSAASVPHMLHRPNNPTLADWLTDGVREELTALCRLECIELGYDCTDP